MPSEMEKMGFKSGASSEAPVSLLERTPRNGREKHEQFLARITHELGDAHVWFKEHPTQVTPALAQEFDLPNDLVEQARLGVAESFGERKVSHLQ